MRQERLRRLLVLTRERRSGRALHAAARKLLRPLVRLLLRHHVPFAAFEEVAKHVYVQVGLEDFGIPGKKPSPSRASSLTGLTRKDVTRLAAEEAPERAASDESYNRAARVLTGWARDADFHAPDGTPAVLGVWVNGVEYDTSTSSFLTDDHPTNGGSQADLRVGMVARVDGSIAIKKAIVLTEDSSIKGLVEQVVGADQFVVMGPAIQTDANARFENGIRPVAGDGVFSAGFIERKSTAPTPPFAVKGIVKNHDMSARTSRSVRSRCTLPFRAAGLPRPPGAACRSMP